MSDVKPIPEGTASISAYLVVKDCRAAMEFYEKAFGAKPGIAMDGPGGAVMHAEVCIGDSTVMLTQENEQWGQKSAESFGGSPISLHWYTEDCDAAFARAVEAGCEAEFPPGDMFWGDRYGKVKDPFGYSWGIATHKEDLSPEEMAERQKAWFASMAAEGECQP